MAEAALYLYERQLQRERLPELTIHLPSPAAAVDKAPAAGGGTPGGAGGTPPGSGGKREGALRIRVDFSGGGAGAAGLHFWGRYAATDSQVRRASAWFPCVDAPGAAVAWEAVEVTCRADEVRGQCAGGLVWQR